MPSLLCVRVGLTLAEAHVGNADNQRRNCNEIMPFLYLLINLYLPFGVRV
jgi:hypothetical protein